MPVTADGDFPRVILVHQMLEIEAARRITHWFSVVLSRDWRNEVRRLRSVAHHVQRRAGYRVKQWPEETTDAFAICRDLNWS